MSATLEDDGVYEELKSLPRKSFEMNNNTCYDGPKAMNERSSRRNQAKKSKSKKFMMILAVVIVVFVVASITVATGLGAVAFGPLRSDSDSEEVSPSQEISRLDGITLQINDSIAMLRLQLIQELSEIEASIRNLSNGRIAVLENITHATDARLQTTIEEFQSMDRTTNAKLLELKNSTLEQFQSMERAVNASISTTQDSYSTLRDVVEQFSNSSTATDQLLKAKVSSLEDQFVTLTQHSPDGQFSFRPAASCAALPDCFPSGYYWVQAANGSAVRVYCEMTRLCGGVTRGWTRVAELDMANTSSQCPSGLQELNESNTRMCVRNLTERLGGCAPIPISVSGNNYTSICGKVIGYKLGSPDAFHSGRLSSFYLDGVSLTRGNPRMHVWSFAAAVSPSNCPCNQSDLNETINSAPSFVGDDYFCETRNSTEAEQMFDTADPLWDGAGCGQENTTCCSFNNPPWFYKQLPQLTTDDIELRLCRSRQRRVREDIAIKAFEIYIQ